MKQFFQPEPEEESEINITPMLDVVFIMLIFFIVTATFVKEAGIDVNRPDAATAVKKENANILVTQSFAGEPLRSAFESLIKRYGLNKNTLDSRLHAYRSELRVILENHGVTI